MLKKVFCVVTLLVAMVATTGCTEVSKITFEDGTEIILDEGTEIEDMIYENIEVENMD